MIGIALGIWALITVMSVMPVKSIPGFASAMAGSVQLVIEPALEGRRSLERGVDALANAANRDVAIVEDAAQDALVDIDAFDLAAIHLQGMARKQPGFVDDAAVGDGQFGGGAADCRPGRPADSETPLRAGSGRLAADRGRARRFGARSVLGDNDLEIAIRLPGQCTQRGRERVIAVVGRHDDRNQLPAGC